MLGDGLREARQQSGEGIDVLRRPPRERAAQVLVAEILGPPPESPPLVGQGEGSTSAVASGGSLLQVASLDGAVAQTTRRGRDDTQALCGRGDREDALGASDGMYEQYCRQIHGWRGVTSCPTRGGRSP